MIDGRHLDLPVLFVPEYQNHALHAMMIRPSQSQLAPV